MPKDKDARKLRQVRHRRVRKKVAGRPEQPRLCVFRSLRFIYAQIIDDAGGKTLVAASSQEALKAAGVEIRPKIALSGAVGTLSWRSGRGNRALPGWYSTAAATSITAGSKPWPKPPAREVWSFNG